MVGVCNAWLFENDLITEYGLGDACPRCFLPALPPLLLLPMARSTAWPDLGCQRAESGAVGLCRCLGPAEHGAQAAVVRVEETAGWLRRETVRVEQRVGMCREAWGVEAVY